MGQTRTVPERVCSSAIVAICTDGYMYGDRVTTGRNEPNAFTQTEMTIETELSAGIGK